MRFKALAGGFIGLFVLLAFMFALAPVTPATATPGFEWTWHRYNTPGLPWFAPGTPGFGDNTDFRYPVQNVVAPLTAENWLYMTNLWYPHPNPAAYQEKRDIIPDFTRNKTVNAQGQQVPPNTIGQWRYFARHDEYQAFIRDLARSPVGSQRMQIKPIGEVPLGFPMTLAVFTHPDDGPVIEPEDVIALNKPVVWIHAAMHANEQDGPAGMQYTMWKLASGAWDHYLRDVTVIMYARVNADGAAYNHRGNPTRPDRRNNVGRDGVPTGRPGTSIDMNRDAGWLESPTIRPFHNIFSRYRPHIAIDHHQMQQVTRVVDGGTVWLANLDIHGNEIRCPTTGRIQLLVQRDENGVPVRNAQGGLINLAVQLPAGFNQETTPHPAGFLGPIWHRGTHFSRCDIGFGIGDHLHIPRIQIDYFYDNIVPFWARHFEERGLHLGWYLEDGSNHSPNNRREGSDFRRLFNPSSVIVRLPDGTYQMQQDGTGYVRGNTTGLWLDYGNHHSVLSMKGAIGNLVESAVSSGHGSWKFERRVYAQHQSHEAHIRYVALNRERFMSMMNRSRQQAVDMQVVHTHMRFAHEPITVALQTWDPFTGARTELEVGVYHQRTVFPNYGMPTPPIRPRPFAYILPRNEINEVTVARMGMHKVEYYTLDREMRLTVEEYVNPHLTFNVHTRTGAARGVTRGLAGQTPWIPASQPTFDSIATKEVTVPAGSFVIPTNQPFAAFITAFMEIDGERSFARLWMNHPYTGAPGPWGPNHTNNVAMGGLNPANPQPGMWSIPYRLMARPVDLPMTRVTQYFPLAENAFIFDVRPVTGPDLAGDFTWAKYLDVDSAAGGFFMHLPRSVADQRIYGYDWASGTYVALERVTDRPYGVDNVFRVSPNFISAQPFAGYSNEGDLPGLHLQVPVTVAMDLRVVRIAARDPEPDPDPDPNGGSSGCNTGFHVFVMLLLVSLPLWNRKRAK